MSGGRSQSASSARPTRVSEKQATSEQRLNQLVAELRLLEAYYQEVEMREQSASAALMDARAASEALSALSSQQEAKELLVPIGGGVLLPVRATSRSKLVVNVGAGLAVEKSPDTAKVFLQNRQGELEKAIASLEQQRRDLAARLEAGRATLQQITQSGT